MKLKVAFHRVNPSQALNKFITQQSEKLKKFFRDQNVQLSWFINKERRAFVPAVNFHYRGKDYRFSSEHHNPYLAVHEVVQKATNGMKR